MAVLVILWYQLFLKKKLFEKFFSTIWKLFLAQKLSFLVRINILKFENRSSKNERILLAPFIFSLLAVVLRRYSSRSFADWPTGGYLLPKSSRATSSIGFALVISKLFVQFHPLCKDEKPSHKESLNPSWQYYQQG